MNDERSGYQPRVIGTIRHSDLCDDGHEELNHKDTANRLENIQMRRYALLEQIERTPKFWTDESLSITYSQILAQVEKQELYKDKKLADKDKGDQDRDALVAMSAYAVIDELRKQRRSEGISGGHSVDHSERVPEVDKSKLSAPNALAIQDKDYKEATWSDFQKQMIAEGKDPKFILDENGNVIPRPAEDNPTVE